MIIKETSYISNTKRKIINNCIPTMIQLTPTNYMRYNNKYFDSDFIDQIYSQIRAEFEKYSNFNNLIEEEYIIIK